MNLSEAFEALKLPNGRPDLNRRRLFLNDLLPLLEKSEMFHVRYLLNQINLNLKGNELLGKLPSKAYLNILDDLDLEDLLRSRLVCQSWYPIFCSVDVCTYAVKKYFPLPIDYYYKKSGLIWTELEESRKKEDWLRMFIINRIRRERGISSKSFELSNNYDLNINSFDLRYSNGRVAILGLYKITIEDLITRQHDIFPLIQNIRNKLWQLSDKYLLVPYDRPNANELVAWDLVSRRKYSTPLFDKVSSISAYQGQVGIITSLGYDNTGSFKSYIWDLENAIKLLLEVKVGASARMENIVVANIFFHVLDKDVVFLVYQTRIETYGEYNTRLTVQCFEAGALVLTQHEIVHTYSRPGEHRIFLITNDGIICFEIWEDPSFRSKDHPYKHITYDTNTRKFLYLDVRVQSKINRTHFSYRNHMWRDQLYNTVRVDKEVKLQVITLSKCLTDIWYGARSSNDCLSQSSLRSSILRGEVRSHCESIEYPIELRYSTGYSKIVWGDDGFLIILLGNILKVWQFDNQGLVPSRQIQKTIYQSS